MSIVNFKGGCGKTSAVLNLASVIAREGKKVLIIDTDSQANIALSFGLKPESIEKTLGQLMAYTDAQNLYGEVISICGRLTNFALQKLSWSIDTTNGLDVVSDKIKDWKLWEQDGLGTPIVVFNPLSWTVTAPIACGSEVKYITDNDGNIVNSQKIRASQTNVEDKYETLFMARIPPMGYTVYRMYKNTVLPSATVACESETSAFLVDDYTLENEYIKVVIDKNTGSIAQIFDTKRDATVLSCTIAKIIDEKDSDTWAHGIDSFNKVVGKFENANSKLIENGRVRAVIRTYSHYNKSTLRQDFILYKQSRQVEVKVKVDWQEQHKMLKLSFPVCVNQPKLACEIPYGHIHRSLNGEEEPCQQWIDLYGTLDNGETCGVSIINNTAYGYDAVDNTINLTVLRSPIFADHFGVRDEFCEFMDQGVHEFGYAIYSHEQDFRQAQTVRRAYEFNVKPHRVIETFHKGHLPCEFTGIDIAAGNIIASALKCAEDGGGYVLRCYETGGVPVETEISLPFLSRTWRAAFTPFEIKTFYIPKDTAQAVFETDLIESR